MIMHAAAGILATGEFMGFDCAIIGYSLFATLELLKSIVSGSTPKSVMIITEKFGKNGEWRLVRDFMNNFKRVGYKA